MYDNIGKKIKGLAKAAFVIVAILSIIMGMILMANATREYESPVVGILYMIIGPIAAWISSWTLYGFGQLIENTDDLVKNSNTLVRQGNTTANETKDEFFFEFSKKNEPISNTNSKIASENDNLDSSSMETKETTSDKTTKDENAIVCPICKFEQPKNRNVCWHCGAKFEDNNQ